MFTSSELHEGEVYTRDILQQMFNITDQTLFTGIFRPAGHDSIGHTGFTTAIMYPFEPSAPYHTPQTNDIQGLQAIYTGYIPS